MLLASLDTMLTATILGHFQVFHGREVNPIADRVIAAFGLPGMLGLKFASVVVVVVVCEAVGKRSPRTGLRLATAVVVLACVPVVVALVQLGIIAFTDVHAPAGGAEGAEGAGEAVGFGRAGPRTGG